MPRSSHITLAATAALILAGFTQADAAGPAIVGFTLKPAAAPVTATPVKTNLPMLAPAQFDVLQHAVAPPAGAAGAFAASPAVASQDAAVGPQQFGTGNVPFTTARVAVAALGPSSSTALTPVSSYPFRATGKLYAHFSNSFPGEPAGWYVCTASLLRKGILITAAHCVFRYGQHVRNVGLTDQLIWYPANNGSSSGGFGSGPYGSYAGVTVRIPTVYFNGTDTCTTAGVVCNNDLATIALATHDGVYAGTVLGTYAWGWNGYSYVTSATLGNKFLAELTQLGYPVAIDNGYLMERTDSVGWFVGVGGGSTTSHQPLKNTQIGSMQTGGSSGGPWIANFGARPIITNSSSSGATFGTGANTNVVVGVTSWGYINNAIKIQGASYWGQNAEFTAATNMIGSFNYGGGNIGAMMKDACTITPAAC